VIHARPHPNGSSNPVPATALGLACAALLGGCMAPPVHGPCPRIPLDVVPYQYEYEGVEQTSVTLVGERWDRIRAAFQGADGAPAERAAIRSAIAHCEQAAGQQTPTWQDIPRSPMVLGAVGQLDCVAESNNTTTFLLLLRQEGLLRFHHVLRPAFRTQWGFFDPHRTALVQDTATNTVYAVDSWLGRTGDEPLIQEYQAWRRKQGPSRTPR
jgi:hypothetical protein